MSTYQRQIADVVRQAKAQGWRERETKGEHLQLFAPDGKGIVSAPKNSTEHRAFNNFLSDMKRHGYRPNDDHATLMENRATKTARQKLLEYGRKHPNGIITPQDAVMLLHVSASASQMAISKLFDEGKLVRVAHGQYRWEFKDEIAPEIGVPDGATINGAAAVAATEEAAQPPVAEPPPAPAPTEPAASIRDADTSELEELAAAMDLVLTGLARLEPIVKRHQVLARKLQDAKRALFDN